MDREIFAEKVRFNLNSNLSPSTIGDRIAYDCGWTPQVGAVITNAILLHDKAKNIDELTTKIVNSFWR